MEKALRQHLPGGAFVVSEQRSAAMRAVKGSANRTTEVKLRLALVRAGLRGWRVRPADLVGKPDFVFSDAALAIFTDGCFWHGCSRCGHSPINTNAGYWAEKIERNRARDARVSRKLRAAGWSVLRIWEHELLRSPDKVIRRIERKLFS